MAGLQQLRRRTGARLAEPFIRALSRCPISPNTVTLAGLVITFLAAWFAYEGRFFTAGLVLGAASFFDLLDGALARATGKTSRFGAILDSASDRVSEAALLAGIGLWFSNQGNELALGITFVCVVSSFLVSYLRARGEAMGLDCTVGLCTRPERVIVLALGLLTGFVFLAVCVVALCASVTVIERLLHLQRKGTKEFEG